MSSYSRNVQQHIVKDVPLTVSITLKINCLISTRGCDNASVVLEGRVEKS